MASSPWNKKTTLDWSEQVEEEEAQNGGTLPSPVAPSPLAQADEDAFPTLGEAAKVKQPKKKKEKKTMSLADFQQSSGSAYGRGPLTDQEILRNLPTAPRERDPNEPQGRWGGGGRGFGARGFGDEGPRRMREEDMGPSRADESSNWGADRKYTPSSERGGGYGGSRREYGGGFSRGFSDYESAGGRREGGFESRYEGRYEGGGRREGGFDDMAGKADATDDWTRDNKFTPTDNRSRYEERRSGFGGGGFRDYDRGPSRGYGFRSRPDYADPGNRADTADRWSHRSGAPAESPPPPTQRKPLELSKRTKPVPEAGVVVPEKVEAKSPRKNPFGDARPREEILKERKSDVLTDRSGAPSDFGSQLGSQLGSQPGSPASSLKDSVRSYQQNPPIRSRPSGDPFGGARPREENLSHRDTSRW